MGARTQSILQQLSREIENSYGNSGGSGGETGRSVDAASNQLSLRQLKRLWEGILSDAEGVVEAVVEGVMGNKQKQHLWDDLKIDQEVQRRIWVSQLTDFAPKAVQDALTMSLHDLGALTGVHAYPRALANLLG